MMNKTMLNKKLSTEELAMVNGGSENGFVLELKNLWGRLTGDPEALAISELRGNYYYGKRKRDIVVNHTPS